MKNKKVIIILIILLMSCFALYTVNRCLPELSSYFAGRFMGYHVTVSKIQWSLHGMTVAARLEGVSFKDRTKEGTIKRCFIDIDTTKGLYFDRIEFSDLDVRLTRSEKQDRFSMPVKLLKIKKGSIAVDKERFFIDELVVDNLNTGKPIRFKADVKSDRLFANIHVTGGGRLEKDKEEIKGEVRYAGANLAILDKTLKGLVQGEGTFHYKKNRLVLQTKAEALGFELMDFWLKKPIIAERPAAKVSLVWSKGITDIAIRDLIHKGTSFALDIRLDGDIFSRFELTSGFVDVPEVSAHATSDYSLQNLWNALGSGKVKANRLLYEREKGTVADLEFKEMDATYEKKHFTDIKGFVFIDGNKVVLKNLQGAYKTNKFLDVNGIVPYSDKPVEAKGRYIFNLIDLPDFVDLRGVKAKEGVTEGTAEVVVHSGTPPAIHGSGKFFDGKMSWKDFSFEADGTYRFTGDGDVTFDSLVIKRDKSSVALHGRWNGNALSFSAKGRVETAHIHALSTMPCRTTGTIGIDGDVAYDGNTLSASGDIIMDDLGFTVPGHMEKKPGTASKARIKMKRTDKGFDIEDLDYRLSNISVQARGHIADGRITKGHIKVDIPAADKIAEIFFLPPHATSGNLIADLAIDDLVFPLKKLPRLRGYVTVSDGIMRLPKLANPLSHVNLRAHFSGDAFNVEVKNLQCGKSTLKSGFFAIKDIDSPKFTLHVDMENFRSIDLFPNTTGSLKIPLILKQSILGGASGEFTLRAGTVTVGAVEGKNLEITGVMADRKISFSEIKMGLFDGNLAFQGVADLSGQTPYLYTHGRLNRIKSGLLLQTLGSTTTEIVGKAFLEVNLKSEGADKEALVKGLSGSMVAYSSDGVIKKWVILSKIFSLLNLYDMFKGKVNFTQSGLAYTKMGAVFTVDKGVFHTDNFLLDSPSMVITGTGDLDAGKRVINGSMVVSPLIAIDRTIDKIPIIRNILKKRNKGFLYLTYNLTGPLDDPQISPTITGTLGSKTIEILRNILVLPIEVPKEVFE